MHPYLYLRYISKVSSPNLLAFRPSYLQTLVRAQLFHKYETNEDLRMLDDAKILLRHSYCTRGVAVERGQSSQRDRGGI